MNERLDDLAQAMVWVKHELVSILKGDHSKIYRSVEHELEIILSIWLVCMEFNQVSVKTNNTRYFTTGKHVCLFDGV